jgi:hypothetical protein
MERRTSVESRHMFPMTEVSGYRLMLTVTGARVPTRFMMPSIVAVEVVSKE